MDAAAEEELSRTYLELYVDYRMTVTGLYFTPLRDPQTPPFHAGIQTLSARPHGAPPSPKQAPRQPTRPE